jgi:hypothetical protein
MLERQMQEMRDLPERVNNLESQILHLRHEIRDEFSSIRSEIRTELVTKGELGEAVTTLRGEIAGAVTTLTKAIADTNTHMRALHEGALSRIATIGEGRRRRKRRS